ncbi:hypothetical protein BJ322DRAFT_1105528 [Thelephora terrestris]|uniref:Uncharacterized protein n=1 Tax=Thelephora terrestris TaxID=56493 RepID=A0A9P6HKZ1_9AGAM|nr:hypothetical protein BJ322DRAFT_1105528 [Thelephora terrestris]
MSATPPHPSLPQAELDKCRSETLMDGHSVVFDTPGSTPSVRGSSTDHGQELSNTSSVDSGYKHEDHEHVYECLDSRVFVDFEAFLKSALHVPPDWKTLWGPAIEAVKADEKFSAHHRPLMKTANTVIGVISARQFDGIPGTPHAGDPRKLWTGVTNGAGFSSDTADPRKNPQPLHSANNLHILEGAICNGKHMPRLIVDGINLISNHAGPPHDPGLRSKPREPASPTTSTTGFESISSTKQHRERSLTGSQRASKSEENKSSSTSTTEAKTQSDSSIRVCSYLLEMFSISLLRLHATVCLVDHGRLQLYHANRSVILVSSAINLSEGNGLDQFIAVIIAFHSLSFKQDGNLDNVVEGNVKLASARGKT